MTEVVVEPARDQFKEEVEIMEENGAAVGELLTREIKKRLLDHAHQNENGDANEEELKPAEQEEEEEQHNSISFDPAKVPNIITEVSARYLVMEAAPSGSEGPNCKEIEAHENGTATETNGSHSNGSSQVSNGAEPEIPYMLRIEKTEIFPTEVNKERVTEAHLEENGSHSNVSHQVSKGADSELAYMFQIDKTEIFPAEDDKNQHVTMAHQEIEEYDLEKILDQQETHDLYCPNCKSCITRRVVLRKRKRTARPMTPDEPPKRPHPEEVPLAPAPGSDGPESPDVFRCLSCFSFFIPTGCSFNIFRIFRRRDQDVDVLPPPASEDIPRSENCTSWLVSCFQPGDSQDQVATDSPQIPPLHTPAIGIIHNPVIEVITDEIPPPKPYDVQRPATPTSENDSFSSEANHTSGFNINSSNGTNVTPGIISAGIPQEADPPHVAVYVPEDVNPGAPRPQQRDDWDILKAIVFGGLVESITSLSVVSAAASSGAKTLDIFILGIANLIGGFPLIYHNIADLRDIQDVDGSDERVGHYWLNLGRRSKSHLHMVMALLSYIVFGLLPPVLYGLSFRESNDRENKMMAVAGASLTCIALLALGKAHVHRRPRTYFKTLMYYLTIAVSSSGLSYVAGVLITRVLASYGIVDEGGASGVPAPPGLSSFPHAVGAETSAWASF